MGDGGLALRARDLQVEVGQPRGDGERHVDHAVWGHSVPELNISVRILSRTRNVPK